MKTSRTRKPAIHVLAKPASRAKSAATPATKPTHKAAHRRRDIGVAPAAPPAVEPAVPAIFSAAPLAIAPAAITGIATTYAGLVVQPPQYNPASGQAAFNVLAPNRAALTKVQVARIDIQAGALAALGAYGFAKQASAVLAQFQAMGKAGLFLMTTLEDLKTAALAALYAFNQAEMAGSYATDAMVPATLVAQASAVEKRMQARCEYAFANDPTVKPLLDMLRPGTGYNDLANDLLGYASIYESKKAQIVATNDPNYRATDLADAKSYAGQLLACLTSSMTPKAKVAYDQLQRLWTLLAAIYAEVQATGLFILRFDPQRHARFPSMTSIARATRSKKKAAAAAPAAPVPQIGGAAASANPVVKA